jgi:4-deoxy-L-threo-5-hexosulose-uronate ketol-isomerase
MYKKVYHATHPDMMQGADNDALRERYLMSGLFQADAVTLYYSHNERFVVGGAAPVNGTVALPTQTEPAGRRGRSVPRASRDGCRQRRGRDRASLWSMARPRTEDARRSLYPDGQQGGDLHLGGRCLARAPLYLVSTPAHARFETVKISIDQAVPLERGSLETSNERTIYQYIVPATCSRPSFCSA